MASSLSLPCPVLQSLLTVLILAPLAAPTSAAQQFTTERYRIAAETVVEGLEHPWAMAFLPGGDMLVTERPGRLRRISRGRLLDQPVSGLPEITAKGQGGLFGIALHPLFSDNNIIYLAYAGRDGWRYGTEVLRGRLEGMALRDVRTIFRALPKSRGSRHFGGRLLFDRA
ncbi:MAG: PQQ-dependent sugar dehydrogenase, partial [Gammaproteobacteria bacterium]|nr:PQQ-dependent sugar dehydrogenase [Gammaproteobacteria bacterium]